jgi:phage tail-like protein
MAIPGSRVDPYGAFNFYISLVESSSTLAQTLTAVNIVFAGGFTECTGLEGTLEVEDYNEGGENRFVHKFATRMTYGNLVLKRGMTFNQDLWQWHLDYVNGRGKRRDGLIALWDKNPDNTVRVWAFKEGMPLKWSGPTFNATQNAFAVETIEIVHHGWKPVPIGLAIEQVGQAFEQVGEGIGNLF